MSQVNIMSVWHISTFSEKFKNNCISFRPFYAMGYTSRFREYKYYSDIFRGSIVSNRKSKGDGNLIVPMAGFGNRFQKKDSINNL